MTQAQDPFFKSIGSLAEQTDQLPDDDAPSQSQSGVLKEGGEEGDERPLQEIESLCMACGKQVCNTRTTSWGGMTDVSGKGSDSIDVDKYTVFPTSHSHVIPMRTLRE